MCSTRLFLSGFDMRVTPSVDLKEFEAKLHQMCAQAGDGVTLKFLQVIARDIVNLVAALD